ncbi:MAG: hypothetical protein CMP49_00390 [Flavobacteriales bacterium]|jgi:hypothetical protein|nr:hypothetical protein [Flavobacteriales bacterium]|tara:strand:- start:7038 stop:7400 length:363 start_codon:yes stop_codon:yes gene_type:complete
MQRNKLEFNKKKWEALVHFISKKFGGGENLDLQAILFLIGVNELGQGYREFTKDEKMNLLHIAICKLLSNYGFYEYKGKDEEGWPHWKTNTELPPLKPGEQTILMKEAAIIYFTESGIKF